MKQFVIKRGYCSLNEVSRKILLPGTWLNSERHTSQRRELSRSSSPNRTEPTSTLHQWWMYLHLGAAAIYSQRAYSELGSLRTQIRR